MSENITDRASIQRKRSARMAAIQGLYNLAVTGAKTPLPVLREQLLQQWKDSIAHQDSEWPSDAQPEHALLDDLLQGVATHRESIDVTLNSIIKDNWKTERMSPVMLATLRCAIYELTHHPERPTAIIIDEYVTITSGFFDNPELGFVNSALHQLSEQLRSA